jgi:RNA polymerase sigma factor (TIGR02999 family)
MSDVTQILSLIESGDTAAAGQLLPLVYDELRKLAAVRLGREKPGQTLNATALVHEAYVRLVDREQPQSWDSRGHFFAAAAESMRRILVESARRKQRLKRGGDRERQDIEAEQLIAPAMDENLGDLIELDAALERENPRQAALVKLRFFAGLTVEETAAALGIGVSTADRDWAYARAWLNRAMAQGGGRASA